MKTNLLFALIFLLFLFNVKGQPYAKLTGIIPIPDFCAAGISPKYNDGTTLTIGSTDIYQFYFWSKDQLGIPLTAASGFTTNGSIGLWSSTSTNILYTIPMDVVELDENEGLVVLTGTTKSITGDSNLLVMVCNVDGTVLCTKWFDYSGNAEIGNAITVGDRNPVTGYRDIYITGNVTYGSDHKKDVIVAKFSFSNGTTPNINLIWDKIFDISNLFTSSSPDFSEDGLDIIFNDMGTFTSGKLLIVGSATDNIGGYQSAFMFDLSEVNGSNVSIGNNYNVLYGGNGVNPGCNFKSVRKYPYDNTIYVMGRIQNASSLDIDLLMMKFDAVGNFVKTKTFDYSNVNDGVSSMLMTSKSSSMPDNGNLYIIGTVNEGSPKKNQVAIYRMDSSLTLFSPGLFLFGKNLDDWGVDISENSSVNPIDLHGHSEDITNDPKPSGTSGNTNLLSVKTNYDFTSIACDIETASLNVYEPEDGDMGHIKLNVISGMRDHSLTVVIQNYNEFDYCNSNTSYKTNPNNIKKLKTNSILVYPNPINNLGTLEITLPNMLFNSKVELVDLNGKTLLSKNFEDPSERVTISLTERYSNGIYFLKLYESNQLIEIKKIIITN